MLPWNIWNLTPRDQTSALLRLVNRAGSVIHAGAGPHTTSIYTVPSEGILLLTNVYVHCVPGSVLTAESELRVNDATGFLMRNRGLYLSNIVGSYNRDIQLTGSPIAMLPPSAVFSFVSTPDAGGDAVYWSISGVLVPRGTIATN